MQVVENEMEKLSPEIKDELSDSKNEDPYLENEVPDPKAKAKKPTSVKPRPKKREA